MTAHLVNLASGWRGGFVALMILAWQSGGVVAQTSASRPAPSGWPVYQASRAATGYSAAPYYPSAQSGYRAPAYSSPQNSFQNPLRGAELRGLWHQPQEYPYSSSRLYPYYNSYLYPYNYGDHRLRQRRPDDGGSNAQPGHDRQRGSAPAHGAGRGDL
jgi:hypothetical protein